MDTETTTPRNDSAPGRRKFVLALLCIFVLAVIIFGIRLASAVHNPFFFGDAGQRLHMAYLPIVRIGNRIWLPMLQGHIWVLYLLRLPYYTFGIIPCFYFFVAMFFLGLFTWQRTAELSGGLIFTLFLMFCFAYQWEVQNFSVQLYQESLGLAFFYVLLWAGALELRPNKWLLPIAGLALLTREDFWIYLFAISLLNYKRILSRVQYRRSFLFLWSIVALWLVSTVFIFRHCVGRYPAFLVEWPLGINKKDHHAVSHLSATISDCFRSLVHSRAIYLVAGLVIVGVIGRVLGRAKDPNSKPADMFEARYRSFSFLSLGIIYVLIILFNPWEATFGSGRLAIPLLAQGFVWASLLFAKTYSYSTSVRILARSVLAAALILSMNPNVSTWIPQRDRPAEKSVQEIAQLVQSAGRNGKANVCVFEKDYWGAMLRFAAPTLYAQWSPHPRDDMNSGTCDLIIQGESSASLVPGANYTKHDEYQLRGRSYVVFQRVSRPLSPVQSSK